MMQYAMLELLACKTLWTSALTSNDKLIDVGINWRTGTSPGLDITDTSVPLTSSATTGF